MFVRHPLIKENSVNLRSYQESIVSLAINKNTLVVLPTGLGKTIIAAMVSAHRLQNFPESKILFLAPTKPLAVQHRKTFSEIFNFPITEDSVLTGIVPIKNREEILNKSKVIFATPQTIENEIFRGLSLENFSLVIFDEAHRAVGNYSYVSIAKEYIKKSKNALILALTASPSSDITTINEICKNLFIEQVEARTETDHDVKPYIQKTKIEFRYVELPEEFLKVKKIIEEILKENLNELKKFSYVKTSELKKVNKRLLLEVQSKIRKEISQGMDSFDQASIVASALKLSHALELLETQGISSLCNYLERLQKQRTKAIKRIFSDERIKNLTKIVHDLHILKVDHPKLEELKKIVSANKGKKILIFTQYRDSVEKIIESLNENNLFAREFIGQATKGEKKGMSQKEQIKILENFKNGKYDALVATSVAEEGLDIPRVDFVIFYEPIPSEIRAIQRRGRTGRTKAGKVIILIAKKTRDESYLWASYHKERKMKELVRKMKESFSFTGQQSLLKYSNENSNENEKKVKIFVDSRERNSRIFEILNENAEIEIRSLQVGDFILSERVCVERKTVNDFLQSIIDKRLFSQVADMTRNFPIAILIIEGDSEIYSLRELHPNAIRGAITSLALDYGTYILYSKDEEDTANFLLLIAKREQFPEIKPIPLHGEKKPLSLEEQQLYVVESLPNISAVLARRLLEKFGSVENVINASEEELMKVDGIGKVKAENIRKVIKSPYKKV
ncbi:MAG: DEAD/DEAH box helicase [Candidatus Altiarchaeota archaeon]